MHFGIKGGFFRVEFSSIPTRLVRSTTPLLQFDYKLKISCVFITKCKILIHQMLLLWCLRELKQIFGDPSEIINPNESELCDYIIGKI